MAKKPNRALEPIDPVGRTNTLFPTFDSLEEVLAYANSKLPKEHHNDLYAILMAYSNTLLKVRHKPTQ